MRRGDTIKLPDAAGAYPREMEQLMALVAEWGLEAGFLGIDGHLEPRMEALLDESVKRLFGDLEAARDRLMAELDSAETAWNQAHQVIKEYRCESAWQAGRASWLRRFRHWLWQTQDYGSAIAVSRREATVMNELRLNLANVERSRRAANAWRETAANSLRASFEFQQERAAIARERKEDSIDGHDTKHFLARRAS